MKTQQKILSAEQTALVTELVETYGLEPEQIIFFENDPKPFLTYEATAVLCNHLTQLVHIGVEPVASAFGDSVAVKCTIILKNGNERSMVGVANLGERFSADSEISEQQAINLASSRALRNVLKAAGIDLLKLHRQAMGGEVLEFTPSGSAKVALLRQAHQLGKESYLIQGDNKAAWYLQLGTRYGVSHSNELVEEQLADFIAFLNTLVPSNKLAA